MFIVYPVKNRKVGVVMLPNGARNRGGNRKQRLGQIVKRLKAKMEDKRNG